MTDRKHIVVIGAGIVGVSTSIWLQRAGHQVTLIDREGPASGTSYGNAGMLTTIGVIPVTVPGLLWKIPKMLFSRDEPLLPRWSYLPKLLPWLIRYLSNANEKDTERISKALAPMVMDSVEQHKALSEGTGATKYIHDCDYVYAYNSAEAALKDAYGWNLRYQRGCRWTEMDQAAFGDYDPALKDRVGYAHVAPNNGYISDPGAYIKALAKHFVDAGGGLVVEEVNDLEISGDTVAAVVTNKGRHACDELVVAAGAWSGKLSKQLGIDPALESERGYHVEFYNPSIVLKSPIMLAAEKIVLTPMDGRLRAAGIVELGGLENGPQQAGFDLLIRQVKKKLPELTYDRIETWMGHRPATTDSIPIVGNGGSCKNAWFGFGHHHVGLTAGPKTGRILADCISGVRSNLDLSVYSPDRFTKSKQS